jgi:acyl-CoA thioesterase I
MVSIAQTVWHVTRNVSAALMLLASGVHPSFAQIVAFGASNTAGFGVGSGAAWPARLEELLHAKGYNVSVANAGISGDTTTGMLGRVDSAVPRGTKLVLLAITNYNDSHRGVDPSRHTANSASIVGHIRALGAKVIMVRFSEVPGRNYRQRDGRHLTAEGHVLLAERLLPHVVAALGRAR